MALIAGLVVALTVIAVAARFRPRRDGRTDLDWMSENWLAQHRASRPD